MCPRLKSLTAFSHSVLVITTLLLLCLNIDISVFVVLALAWLSKLIPIIEFARKVVWLGLLDVTVLDCLAAETGFVSALRASSLGFSALSCLADSHFAKSLIIV